MIYDMVMIFDTISWLYDIDMITMVDIDMITMVDMTYMKYVELSYDMVYDIWCIIYDTSSYVIIKLYMIFDAYSIDLFHHLGCS